jgi:hypothetical protein
VKNHQKAIRFSKYRIFSHKFSFFGEKKLPKNQKQNWFFFGGRGSPYLCVLATVLKFLEIMFLVKLKSL